MKIPASISVRSDANAQALDRAYGRVFGDYRADFSHAFLSDVDALWDFAKHDLIKQLHELSPWERNRFITTYLENLIRR